MRRVLGMVLAGVLAVAATNGAARAQTPPAANTLVRVTAAPVQVTAGRSATVHVHLVIAPGWHIYSNPPGLEYNIPTKVSLAAGLGLTAGRPGYPAGRKVKLASDEQEMSVYDGEVEVTLPLAAARTAIDGDHALRPPPRPLPGRDSRRRADHCLPHGHRLQYLDVGARRSY